MKLRNKKTWMIGEAGYLANSHGTIIVNNIDDQDEWYEYASLAKLNEEWEDYQEPKEYWWYIDNLGVVNQATFITVVEQAMAKDSKEIGNYFETKEEAEKAVERLKAWKRLKDKGFRFEGWDNTDHSTIHNFSLFVAIEDLENINKNLDLLFGGDK